MKTRPDALKHRMPPGDLRVGSDFSPADFVEGLGGQLRLSAVSLLLEFGAAL